MKKTMMIIACMCLALSAWAVPAKRGVTKTVTKADGTTMTVSLCGDESFHYYVDENGTAVREDEQGLWVEDTRDVKTLWTTASTRRNAHRKQLAQKMRKQLAGRRAAKGAAEMTVKRGLLILVNFQDLKMVNGDNSNAIYEQMMNGLGNPYGKNFGSVREYFRAQSYNQFDIIFDVVGPVTVSQNMSYYGRDLAGYEEGTDAHAEQMVKEACDLADPYVNFADYDWDGDGEVENIYVTYAGYGQAQGGASNTIWPHQYVLSEEYGTVKKDGVKIDTYATGNELNGYSGRTIDGIGTMCHEYSHCLGLPDFYDTSGTNFGMNCWSLMDYGSYNADGYHPAGYTAYERWYSGWLEPEVLNSSKNVKDMPDIETNPVAYVVYNDANHNEYYLLANHQQKEWDKKLPGHGMMVMHVDYDQSSWVSNTVNTSSNRQRMTIIPADGRLNATTKQLAGDLWPGTSKKTALTDETSPAATLYRANTDGKKLMHKPIEDIAETNGLISFHFMKSSTLLPTPVLLEPSAVWSAGFTANWQAVEGATSYRLKLTEVSGSTGEVGDAVVLAEDFSALKSSTDGQKDYGTTLDSYMSATGWTGTKVFSGVYGAKMGSAKANGILTSPQISGNTTGEVSLFLRTADWVSSSGSRDNSRLTIRVMNTMSEEVASYNLVNPAIPSSGDELALTEIHFSNVPESYLIILTASKRYYLGYLLCLNGHYTAEDVAPVMNASTRAHAPLRAAGSVEYQGITSTSYTFSGLTAGSTYRYCVQAVDAEGDCSDWTDNASVVLPAEDAVAVRSVSAPVRSSEVYDLSGRRVPVGATMRKGLYITRGKKIAIQ